MEGGMEVGRLQETRVCMLQLVTDVATVVRGKHRSKQPHLR